MYLYLYYKHFFIYTYYFLGRMVNGYMVRLRVLSSVELFMYPSYYCRKHLSFLLLFQTFEKAETHFFTMPIKISTIYSDLKNEEAVKFELSKEWSSIGPCHCHN